MPGYTSQATERIKVLSMVQTSGVLAAPSSRQTATIDMGNFRRLVVIGSAIGTAASATGAHAKIKILDATLTGTAAHTAIVTRTITVRTAGLARWKILEITDQDVAQNVGTVGSTLGRYVRVRGVWGTRAAQIQFSVLGMDARYEPHSNVVTRG